jgi:hypothetical protein
LRVVCLLLFSYLAVLFLVHYPFHVINALVPFFLAHLLDFWFIVLGRDLLPLFLLLLKALVSRVLLVLRMVLLGTLGFLLAPHSQ